MKRYIYLMVDTSRGIQSISFASIGVFVQSCEIQSVIQRSAFFQISSACHWESSDEP